LLRNTDNKLSVPPAAKIPLLTRVPAVPGQLLSEPEKSTVRFFLLRASMPLEAALRALRELPPASWQSSSTILKVCAHGP
jgi:hypothetical protein